jgi:hypothetical protein
MLWAKQLTMSNEQLTIKSIRKTLRENEEKPINLGLNITITN